MIGGERRPRFALLALVALASAGLCAQAEECHHYDPEVVTLEGALQLKAFAGAPNYQSVEFGDQPEAVWILTLPHPICITGHTDNEGNIAQFGVQTIEIVPRTTFTPALSGKAVQVQGILSRAQGAHRHAPVLLRATAVTPNQP